MQLTIRGLVALAAMLFSTITIQTAVAGEVPGVSAPADIYVMAAYTDADGFVVEVPAIDPQLLAEQLQDLRAELLLRRVELITEMEDLEVDGTYVTLSALLAGGLIYAGYHLPVGIIYAGYRKREYKTAKHDLAEVNAELDDLAQDLSNFGSALGNVALRTVE
jgi:hypothetical protein